MAKKLEIYGGIAGDQLRHDFSPDEIAAANLSDAELELLASMVERVREYSELEAALVEASKSAMAAAQNVETLRVAMVKAYPPTDFLTELKRVARLRHPNAFGAGEVAETK